MATKTYQLSSGQVISLSKKKTNRNIKLSINAHGQIRVSLPYWAPYRAGIEFAKSKQAWIDEQVKPQIMLFDNQAVGKAHRLYFIFNKDSKLIKTKTINTEIRVFLPINAHISDNEVQHRAKQACIKALRSEAQQLLPLKLNTLAKAHGYEFNQVSIKQLRGRWGSCDSNKNIVLNLFLMQLPWELIDFVLLHELTHTKVMKHGPKFWESITVISPNAKALSRKLKKYQPVLNSQA